jgi:hypothetical protein
MGKSGYGYRDPNESGSTTLLKSMRSPKTAEKYPYALYIIMYTYFFLFRSMGGENNIYTDALYVSATAAPAEEIRTKKRYREDQQDPVYKEIKRYKLAHPPISISY